MAKQPEFSFAISLSVLNHLGRNLYRSFATVLGEAISNAWDADATEVRIYLDDDHEGFWIVDNGTGMNAKDFQDKFLKIGYSKRKGGKHKSPNGRPFIGRKGIGKLALLSCADRISVLSRKSNTKYVGGVIDNTGLNAAIVSDATPDKYKLEDVDLEQFGPYMEEHTRGTIIHFDGLKEGVRRSPEFLGKTIALFFRFSLIDKKFKVYVNDKLITHKKLEPLAERTQFLWKVGKIQDPYVKGLEQRFAKQEGRHEIGSFTLSGVSGFVASVRKPRNLTIETMEERVGVDLFVNGRLRERNILAHIPTSRIVENYLYGQIHFNGLDGDKIDRFTSSREGVVADDKDYQHFLEQLRSRVLLKIAEQWDKWRLKHGDDGDSENKRVSKSERASRNLFGAVSNQYSPPEGSPNKDLVDQWVAGLREDSTFNFEAYADCYVAENLLREFIRHNKVPLSTDAIDQAEEMKGKVKNALGKANISIKVRKSDQDIDYLDMTQLCNMLDKDKNEDKFKVTALSRDAVEYKPMRDAMAHTSGLTDLAKQRLRLVGQNVQARMKTLIAEQGKPSSSSDQS